MKKRWQDFRGRVDAVPGVHFAEDVETEPDHGSRNESNHSSDVAAGAIRPRRPRSTSGRAPILSAILLVTSLLLTGSGSPALAADDEAPLADLSLGSGISAAAAGPQWNGWVQADMAYATPSPGHFTHLRTRGELAGRGDWGDGMRWRLSARASLDGAFSSDHYPHAVRRDQRAEVSLHEAYVDFSGGDWEFRLGKQNIVWGEMVGLFFADVVSAKDMRDSVLPEFDQIRIPQWAARAEWFGGDSHLELVWLPWPDVDDIGKPGAEFYPYPLQYEGYGYVIDGERRPKRKLSRSGIGARWSTLVDGWDWSAFVYRAPDTQAAFYRSLGPGPTPDLAPIVHWRARHDQVTRIGGTVTKDFDGIVFKAEAIHTRGRGFQLLPLDAGNGVTKLRTLDWIAGLDLTPVARWRINTQLFQRVFLDHERATGMKRYETGATLLVTHEITDRIDGEFLAISSLNRSDRLLRASLSWAYDANLRFRAGIDTFSGHPLGLFGRYDDSDRVWLEARYSF